MKNIAFVLGACMMLTYASAQTVLESDTVKHPDMRFWKFSLEGGINVNQAYFSDSWKGGGVNSIALSGYIYGKASYQKNRWMWDNTLKMQYGMQKNNGQGWRKNMDMIDFTTKGKFKIVDGLNVFASGNFISQFYKGFEYTGVFDSLGREEKKQISGFLSPGYVQESFGLEYKPVDWFYVNVGALALRQTIVKDTTLYHNVPNNYGVDIGKTFLNQIGFSFETAVDKTIAKNLNIKYKYRAFTDYNVKKFDQVIHRMDLVITATVIKFLKVSLSGIMIYDMSMDKRVQWNQGLALGIGYKLTNFKESKK